MDLQALILSRLQFAFTMSFHIMFPAFTIGLASYLAVLEALWLKTGDSAFYSLYRYWLRIFALSFGLGVVSGVVMSYQFGMNWSRFSANTGNVLGPLLGYEVLTAFFLEASFLGIMLFGIDRVGRGLHFLATCIVAGGTLISAFWILAANSWMQTPAGYEFRDGVFYATDWLQVIFNPSFPYRFVHMVMAAYITTAFVVAGVGGWLLLKGRRDHSINIMLKMALTMLVIAVPVQLIVGDLSGKKVYDMQPAKLAAIEGHWESYPEGYAPLVLFGWPSETEQRNLFQLEVPQIGSWIVSGRMDGPIQGLKSFAEDHRPPVVLPFWMFRIMVGLGFLMLATAVIGTWLIWRERIEAHRWFQRLLVCMLPSGFVAVISGWITAEVGRQPWTVYNVMRTADSVSPVSGANVGLSLLVFVLVYAIVFTAGIVYMGRLAGQGPDTMPPAPVPDGEDVPPFVAPHAIAATNSEARR